MTKYRIICRWLCATLAASLCIALARAGEAPPTIETVLARLAALEQKVEKLTDENKQLREQLGYNAKAPAPIVVARPAGKESKLSVGGFFHLHGEAGGMPDTRWAGIHDRFLIRRARLAATGSFAEKFSFKLEGDFGNNSISGRSGYSVQMTDGYVTWAPSEAASVRVGQFKTPFGYEQLMSDTKNPMVERSLPNDRLTMSRQIGAGVFGDVVPKKFSYSVGMFNGNGINNGDNDNDEFLWVGRLNGTLAGSTKLRLEGGINAFTMDSPGATTGRDGYGIDLQLTCGPAMVMGEWLRNDFTTSSGGSYSADGWSLLGVWTVDKNWQLLGRYESYESNTSLPGSSTREWTVGGSYLIKGDDLKLTLNYLRGDIDGTGSDGRILGRLQLVY
jgi:phosphate-selective porin OprO and OprP